MLTYADWLKDSNSSLELIPVAIIFNSFEQRTQDKFGDIQLGYFDYLIDNANKYGLDMFICKRDDLLTDDDNITGYLRRDDNWITINKPYPKAVYQREGSYRYAVHEHLLSRGVKLYQEIPMLRTVTNKLKTAELIEKSGVLTPKSEVYSAEKMLEYIKNNKPCFIKPTYGQLGEGAIKINPDYTYKISDKLVNTNEETIVKEVESLIQDKWKLRLDQFLIQDLVDMPKYRNSVFDARVMMQKNANGEIEYIAHMARIGADNKITSNIHTGGSFDKLEKVLMHCYNDETLVNNLLKDVRKGSFDVCNNLEKIGHFGELGFDWLFTKDGKAVCIEINPRPGKYIFSNLPETTKTLRDNVLKYLRFILQ